MTPRLNGETRGPSRKAKHVPPDGYHWVPRGHRIPERSLKWVDRLGEWRDEERPGRLCPKASRYCAPIGTAERPVERDNSAQRWPTGWHSLGCAIMEQAVQDTRALLSAGVIKDGMAGEWPTTTSDAGRVLPARINDMQSRVDAVELIDWWGGEWPEILAQAIHLPADMSAVRAAVGVAR